jgi:hypothetical protein
MIRETGRFAKPFKAYLCHHKGKGDSSPKLQGEIDEIKIRGIEDLLRQSIPYL